MSEDLVTIHNLFFKCQNNNLIDKATVRLFVCNFFPYKNGSFCMCYVDVLLMVVLDETLTEKS